MSLYVSRASTLRLLALLSALGLGCQPSIGSQCNLSTDCSPMGDRLCDTSQPLGYCTIFNCGPNSCPPEAACVATNPAEVGCPYDDRHSPSRFSRQMCLFVCNSDGDCRGGYACRDPSEVGALLLDTIRGKKVCLPATTYFAADASPAPVCSVSGPTLPPIEAGPGFDLDASEADAPAEAQAADAAAE